MRIFPTQEPTQAGRWAVLWLTCILSFRDIGADGFEKDDEQLQQAIEEDGDEEVHYG